MTIYLLITQLDDDGNCDHELFSSRPTFPLREEFQTLLEGDVDGGDMLQIFPPSLCHLDDCLNPHTISRLVDLDPADPEVGPQPNIATLLACSEEHMTRLLADIVGADV